MVSPDFSTETRRELDNIYDRLFILFTDGDDKYFSEAEKAREVIAELKPPAPVIYRPYPKVTDKNFNEKIAKKDEFNRYRLTPEYSVDHDKNSSKSSTNTKANLSNTTDFKLSNNQKFLKNFLSPMTPYNGLLLFHGVGVGKTCTAISIAEQYLIEPDSKRVLVILSSNIKDNFRKQIFDITKYNVQTNESLLCTGTRYPDMVMDKNIISKEQLEKRINKIIKERYQFVGYKELVEITKRIMEGVKKNEKNIEKHEQRYEEKVRELFSDRLIIIDEAHNLRLPSENGKKQVSNTLLQIIKIATNTKLVLLSATPMYNNAREILYLLNILLTNDRREMSFKGCFDKEGNLSSKGKTMLVKAARGYVSFMRGENPFTYPFRLSPSINDDKKIIKVFPTIDTTGKAIKQEDMIKYIELVGSQMSAYQKSIYERMKGISNLETYEDSDDEAKEDIDEDESNDLQNAIQLSNIVYPSSGINETIKELYGSSGFSRCFEKRDKKEVKYKAKVVKDHGEFLRYDSIAQYSPKIKSILDYVINSRGIVFIYTQYYWAGVYPLAVALEHIGLVKYKSGQNSRNMASGITVDNKFGKKRPSYIILSRDKELSPNNDKEIADAKLSGNIDGDLIKVIIVTKVGAEGIDFKCIREIHIMEPWFNLNRLEQITGRGIRTYSHVSLPKEERNTTVYYHATTYTTKEESVDIKIYRFAEKKQKTINEVQKLLKQGAIDCNLNITNLYYPIDKLNMTMKIVTSQGKNINNYKVGDRENSYICDYGKCELQCLPVVNMNTVSTNSTTFDPYYIIDDIDICKKYVARLYKGDVLQYTFNDIYTIIKSNYMTLEEDVLSFTLQEMLDNKIKITKTNGRQGYLIYRGDTYIFQDSKHYETKLTKEEKVSMNKRSKLDFDILNIQRLTKEAKKDVTNNVNRDVNKKKVITDDNIENNIKDIPKKTDNIKKSYESLRKLVSPYDIPDEVIIESIIDKMSFDELESVLVTGDKNDIIYLNLINSDIVIKNEKGIPSHVYNHLDDSFYSILTSGLKKIGPLEQAKISTSISGVEEKLKYKNEKYKGLIEFSKKNEANFKVRDSDKTRGFVCHQTSSLTLNELRERVNNLIPKKAVIAKNDKINKKILCNLYELLLRKQGSTVFKRVFHKD